MEKTIANRLTNNIDKMSILYPLQFDFITEHSAYRYGIN